MQHYGISLNSDYDEIEATLAEIEQKSEWDINPFEVQVIRHFADWCLRGDIGVIIDLDTDFYVRMKKAGINPLIKGNEGYKTWNILDLYEKRYLTNIILSYYFLYISEMSV